MSYVGEQLKIVWIVIGIAIAIVIGIVGGIGYLFGRRKDKDE